MKFFFPEEYEDELSAETTLIRDILFLETKLIRGDLSTVNRARIIKKRDELQNRLNIATEELQKTSIHHQLAIWKNFNELCLSLSRLDGKMSFKEVQKLSVYDIYTLKIYLIKVNTKRKETDG